jgi:hypothetical protein
MAQDTAEVMARVMARVTVRVTVEATAIIWAVTALDRVMGITWVAMVQALVGSKMQLKGWSHYSTPLFYVLFEKLFIGV